MNLFSENALLYIAIGFGVVKIASTVAQLAWPGGAVALTRSGTGRLLYFAGKVSPIGVVGALLVRAQQSNSPDAAVLTWALAVVCLMVAVVVGLRASGRWYGLAHTLRSNGPEHEA